LENNDDLAKFNDDVSYLSANQRGAPVVKRLLHSVVDQHSLINDSRSRPRTRHRRLRKKLSSIKLKNSPNLFQSTGTYNNHIQAPKRINTVIDDRLKRFRMLDPDEFQEMLNSWSHQMPDQPIKELDSMDTIGGMQLESKLIYYFFYFLIINFI
jgi:hypothetical protein